MRGLRLFNSRMVNEIKGKATPNPYEKSRLVIQAYHDLEKSNLLTQSPTIQRASQRLILVLTPSLLSTCSLCLRDISQAYVQSSTKLNREIIAKPPAEIASQMPENSVLKILKPLYGIPEAGTHWYNTYHKHHCEKLFMKTSTYDPCLLISDKKEIFGLVGMQTDDTLILGNKNFILLENDEIINANLLAKPIQTLSSENPLVFNGCILTFDEKDKSIKLLQKDQGKRIELIDDKLLTYKQDYFICRCTKSKSNKI
ncbi:hypothetical protein EV44_g5522 [Erysiphe necator]|uniref:Reverse transcriptase Ty1/copia-type domain-containing protein n=1 Tax=Uncinula necator TaxID=52586 RepID=A0A0B1P8N8_UNCNE|nr:hypothetical protein EV44_g5522 [Erysiphe necator]